MWKSCHAWGMTEMSPLGSLGSMKPECDDAGSRHHRRACKLKQGRAPFGVEMKTINDDANAAAARWQDVRRALRCAGRRSPRAISWRCRREYPGR